MWEDYVSHILEMCPLTSFLFEWHERPKIANGSLRFQYNVVFSSDIIFPLGSKTSKPKTNKQKYLSKVVEKGNNNVTNESLALI